MSWICSTCGQLHEGIPLSFAVDYPDNYANLKQDEQKNRALLGSDQCIIDESEFYIRGLIEIPVHGVAEPFLWGVWASIWPEDFDAIADTWEREGREKIIGPFKGRLANNLPEYAHSSANLKLRIEVRPVSVRPLFVIEEPEHPLAIAQRDGMTRKQAYALAEAILHRGFLP